MHDSVLTIIKNRTKTTQIQRIMIIIKIIIKIMVTFQQRFSNGLAALMYISHAETHTNV